jgi:anti-sigma B factor antagonist
MAAPGLLMNEDDVDGTWTLGVHGELDLNTAPDLCARLETHRGEHVLVDLTDLEFCDSCGLRALIGEAREARFAGGRLSVVAPTEGPVRRLLEMTGLTEALGVHGDVAQALAAR